MLCIFEEKIKVFHKSNFILHISLLYRSCSANVYGLLSTFVPLQTSSVQTLPHRRFKNVTGHINHIAIHKKKKIHCVLAR